MSVITETRFAPRRTASPVDTSGPVAGEARAGLGTRIRTRHWWRHLGRLLTGAGLAMIPWLFVLAATLPARTTAAHWSTVWVGLDSLEAFGLIGTGLLLRRRDPRASLTSAATAVLLAVDAWFDVLTAAPGADRLTAITMAAGAELPLSAMCAVLALRLFPRPERS